MSFAPTVANLAWLAGGIGQVRRFQQALSDPASAQEQLLRRLLSKHSVSDYGRRYDFATTGNAAEYSRRVPMVRYEDLEPDVLRISRGERDVLAVGRVSHLAPTSGSAGGRKLIPFTDGLTSAFNAAVYPWMADLVRQRPRLVGGPAYWSISPPIESPRSDSAVPIGFADDADYLGGGRAWLVRKALAVPSRVRHANTPAAFWRQTLLALLTTRDLRLISVWHPSFLEMLIEIASRSWSELLDAIEPRRANELRRAGSGDWPAWWPDLQVLSCWGEQAAEPGWLALMKRLPHVLVQPKGLMATECAVTVPLGNAHVLAVTSHFFEFLDERGDVRLSHQLGKGERYEVVVTNGGGLWRYRLGDMVECTGSVAATPTLRFLGRAGNVSDLRGEKLDEVFVAEVLRNLWSDGERPPWVALRPQTSETKPGYDLLVSGKGDTGESLELRTEESLAANPHYRLARQLGQLRAVRVVRVADDAGVRAMQDWQGRIGDAKPRVLLRETDRY